MKLLFLPLKLTTEAIWLAARAVRKVTGREWESDRPSPASPAMSPRPSWGEGDAPAGAESAFVGGSPEPEGGFAVGDRVVLSDGATVKGLAVPAGASGRVESREGGVYAFLWYTDDGAPVLVRDVPGAGLRGL